MKYELIELGINKEKFLMIDGKFKIVLEEEEKEFNNFMEAHKEFNNYRLKESLGAVEFCSNCGADSLINNDFQIQRCSECKEIIFPCNLCLMDYVKCGSDCILQKEIIELNTYSDEIFRVTKKELESFITTGIYDYENIEEFLDNYTYDDTEFIKRIIGIACEAE